MERHVTPQSFAETVAVNALAVGAPGSSVQQTTSAPVVDEGRFVPGTMLGGRYRIIALLGRGGMGEVYRATDLALGQSVALKFLPAEAAANPRLLERFHGEVRVARLVSHPNVCRVYDIGEVEGTPFISMEYVDGEDLASLLTRIGRLPAGKALDTARKLCAGLSAAHDRGVIHRDLKPQNVMINKRGEVVIMDFGLAAIADQLSGAEARNGTPAYMAPEQLRGAEVTARSDIYALGLVIYELFTGRKPYEAQSLQQLIDLQESANLTSMSSIAGDIDPAVEKVIRRCLDPDPQKRPSSPLAVITALPGGDPLAAALAAGETPSPELVAAACKQNGMERRYSVPCLLTIALALFGSIWFNDRTRAMPRTDLPDSPEVLAHKSREVAAAFGYSRKPADSALWLAHRDGLVDHLNKLPAPRRFTAWLGAEAPISSIYRESPASLRAEPYGRVDADTPPPTQPGMSTATLDGRGKLIEFTAVPYDDMPPLAQPVTPEAVFRAAGLDVSRFQEIPPSATPPGACDRQLEWKGPHPVLPDTELTVEAAWWKGRITQARVRYPWDRAAVGRTGAPESAAAKMRGAFGLLLFGSMALMVVLLARRNWKHGRTDPAGALRVGAVRALLAMAAWAGTVHPVPSFSMLNVGLASSAEWLFAGALVWLLYLALEPAVRANWPHSLVTWNRALAGHWLDAQVGAHVLIGAAAGCTLWLVATVMQAAFSRDELDTGGNLVFTMGVRAWAGTHALALGIALQAGLLVFFVIFLVRLLVRRNLLAAVATALSMAALEGNVQKASNWPLTYAVYVLLFSGLIFVLLRFGLVTIMAAIYFLNGFSGITVAGDWTVWYAPAGLATLALLLGIAVFAFWLSLGERELIGGDA
jgi:hypothetical protein